MGNLFNSSYGKDNNCDGGISPILLVLLLTMCGGDNGVLGGCNGNDSCGCNGGMTGMLPILLLLLLCGGSC